MDDVNFEERKRERESEEVIDIYKASFQFSNLNSYLYTSNILNDFLFKFGT